MFSRILIPVDGSDNSYRALDAALFLSEKLDAEVTAIHIMDDAPVSYVVSEKVRREIVDPYKSEHQLILSKCSEIATKKGLIMKTELIEGNPLLPSAYGICPFHFVMACH